jgi:hypothetical protein
MDEVFSDSKPKVLRDLHREVVDCCSLSTVHVTLHGLFTFRERKVPLRLHVRTLTKGRGQADPRL